jgi:hypothetical protein
MLQVSFISVSFLSLLFLYFGTGKDKKLLLLFVMWGFLIGSLAVAEVFKDKPNLFPLAILGTVVLTIVSIKWTDSQKIHPKMLLAIHILRIPVELILYQLYLQDKIPKLMTYTGWNFDILIGVSALVILVYLLLTQRKLKKGLIIIWNIIGIVFLLIIISLGILSSPLPIQQFAFEQPNIAILEFPYCFLPTCVVPIVLIAHILLISQQMKQPSQT